MQIYIQSSMHILSIFLVINYFKHLLMAEHYETDKGSQSNFSSAIN